MALTGSPWSVHSLSPSCVCRQMDVHLDAVCLSAARMLLPLHLSPRDLSAGFSPVKIPGRLNHSSEWPDLFLRSIIYLATPGLSCGMQDLVPWPETKPRPPALGAQRLGPWVTREVSRLTNAWLESVSTPCPRFPTGLSSHQAGRCRPWGSSTSFAASWEGPDTAGSCNSWGRAVAFSSLRDCSFQLVWGCISHASPGVGDFFCLRFWRSLVQYCL